MINVFGSTVSQEEIQAVSSVMQQQWMGFGKKVDEFEEAFKKSRNTENFLLVDSGSNALFMALHLLDLPKGSEVIVPTYTWVSCAQAVLLVGCVPIFADVDPATHNITADLIKPHITEKTSAIMVVHYAGKPVDMDPIIELGLPVVEDAAHAVDSFYKGKICGSIGDVGIFSFDSVKNITTIEVELSSKTRKSTKGQKNSGIVELVNLVLMLQLTQLKEKTGGGNTIFQSLL